jgi:dienelactone hydrolase
MQIATKHVPYKDSDTSLNGVFFWDESQNTKRPGVLVVHGGPGLDDHPKNRARRFAELGYVAFACDMYGEGIAGNRERTISTITELRAEPGRIAKRASAAVEVLRAHPLSDGRVVAVGYCFGGMTVLELARSGAPLDGVVSVHGSYDTKHPAGPDGIKAKVLVCHGALDPHVPMAQLTAFADEMKETNADWQAVIFGNAMHAFTHEGLPSIPGVAYHAPSDARCWRAIETFLAELFPA